MVIFTLTLVRHGETSHNKHNVIQGQLDIPLSNIGLEQAQKLGIHLQHQKYTHVYSSDLIRAKCTAEKILSQSQVCNVAIVEDKMLRERKFGVIEGKSIKFLKEAARKCNQSVLQVTPSGAETVQEVQDRAHSFFKDLCQLMRETAVKQNSVEENSTYQDKVTNSSATTNNGANSLPSIVYPYRSKRKREDSCDGTLNNNIFSNGSVVNPAAPQKTTSSITQQNQHCDTEASKNFSADDTGCDHLCASSTDPSVKAKPQLGQVAPTFTDEAIRSQLTPCKCETEDSDCPNVSLSPLVSHTNSSNPSNSAGDAAATAGVCYDKCMFSSSDSLNPTASSMSLLNTRDSDRERRTSICSSNDENDSSPDVVGNILVVSHGGLLKELILYFVEKLGCSVPGGKKQAMRISPNAGLSKFTVSLTDNEDDVPKIICHQIHDKHHLSDFMGNTFDGSQLIAENTAL